MPKTVVLTGVTGFIAKRIALDLLEAGHSVRGSLRAMTRADEVRDALRSQLTDPAALDRLSFVELDLSSDAGWTEAMQGADVLMHTASPFPMAQPSNPDEIVRPAVDGTLRALNAAKAAGISRVILTSSMVAIMYGEFANSRAVTEADWTEQDHPTVTPYTLSKTRAEEAAWAFMAENPDMTLTTINPGLVVGTPMDANYGTSLAVVERILAAKDPMMPEVAFPVVHLNDVSKLHVQAVDDDAMLNTRTMAAEGVRTMLDMGKLLAGAFPDRKISTRKAPAFLLRILSIFDKSLTAIMPQLGVIYRINNSATVARTGIDFVGSDDAILEAARYLASRSA